MSGGRVDRVSSSDAPGNRFYGFFTQMPRGFHIARRCPNLRIREWGGGNKKDEKTLACSSGRSKLIYQDKENCVIHHTWYLLDSKLIRQMKLSFPHVPRPMEEFKLEQRFLTRKNVIYFVFSHDGAQVNLLSSKLLLGTSKAAYFNILYFPMFLLR